MNKIGRTILSARLQADAFRVLSQNLQKDKGKTLNPICNGIQVRSAGLKAGFVWKQVRTPVRVYLPGEKIPTSESTRPVIKTSSGLEHRELEESSKATFNAVMGAIHKNKVRKSIAVEGTRMIEEALLAGLKLEKLFLLKSLKEVPAKINSLMNDNVEIHKLGQKHMQVWSSLTTPPGAIGIFVKPKYGEIVSRSQGQDAELLLPLTVICDNLREPGNLGSLLRSAAGAGCKKVLLSKGCVDPWESKVLRGGCGAQFRVPIDEDVPIHSISAELESDSEKWGLGGAEGSIGIFLADSNCEDGRSGLPLLSYADVDYTAFRQLFLIVGGETEGLSTDTLQITSSLRPPSSSQVRTTVARLHIPLQNQMESLNVAHAFGIIAFEVQRQYASSTTARNNT